MLHEIEKGLAQTAKIMAVGFHMISVDVGHHREHWRQIEEGRIGLVGFDDDEFTAAKFGVRTGGLQPSANDKRRIHAGLGQHARHQTGGGGLAVSAGNRDTLLQTHQLGEHHGARHHWNLVRSRSNHFGVIFLNCA